MSRRAIVLLLCLGVIGAVVVGVGAFGDRAPATATPAVPLRTGVDGSIRDAEDRPVRLVGFNWTGTELGGRSDPQKTADDCGVTWRVPADPIGSQFGNYDSIYADIRAAGYNVLRVPISWNNLEPVAPVWDESSKRYVHTWNSTYLRDLRSMVSKSRDAGLMVILDMHQDLWSPALHNITETKGKKARCEGAGMPRWLYPTMDAKESTTAKTDLKDASNWFYRNVHDPLSTVTKADPWQLLYAAWDQLAREFSAESGFADYQAVVGADLLNEPYIAHVGGNPSAGQTVLEASGDRLQALYESLAPAVTAHNPSWLLVFQDSSGGYNAANPDSRETPTMTAKPSAPGNWVYSVHLYNPGYGTFADGVPGHDDFGVTVAEKALANARAWGVPLLIGEFTYFTLGKDAHELTEADMEQTSRFVSWARVNRVGWMFWAYVNPYRSMTVVDHATNLPIPVPKGALDAGLDASGNRAPAASFTSTCTGLACSFDAEASDPDGSVMRYAWTFGDGSTGSGRVPNHAYAEPKTYAVSLTTTDDQGATETQWSAVTLSRPSALHASDSFSRAVSNGWGAADAGGSWTIVGPKMLFSVGGGTGTMTLRAPGAGLVSQLGAVSSTSADVQVTATTDKAPSGGGVYVSVVGRRVPGSGDYRVKVRLLSTGGVGISIVRSSASGKETALSAESVVSGLTIAPQAGVRIRFQVTGTQPATLRAKVWAASDPEPTDWAATAGDATSTLQKPGSVGVAGYLSSAATNAPIVIRLDDFQAGPVG